MSSPTLDRRLIPVPHVARVRQDRKLSQVALARRAGISQQRLSVLELRGTARPMTITALARALDVPVEALTGPMLDNLPPPTGVPETSMPWLRQVPVPYLRVIRQSRALSQRKLAEATGLWPKTISRAEVRGTTHADHLAPLAQALGVTEQEITGQPA